MSAHARPRLRPWIVLGTVLIVGLALVAARTYYPLTHLDAIRAAAAAYGLRPELVCAVVRAESRFRPGVVSPVGAIGMMQIMPSTGEWIAHERGLESFDVDSLFEPNLNIDMGTWYLGYLLGRFQDETQALMAYHAGPSRVENWGEGLESAFPETKEYVARVLRLVPVYRICLVAPWLAELIPSLRF